MFPFLAPDKKNNQRISDIVGPILTIYSTYSKAQGTKFNWVVSKFTLLFRRRITWVQSQVQGAEGMDLGVFWA